MITIGVDQIQNAGWYVVASLSSKRLYGAHVHLYSEARYTLQQAQATAASLSRRIVGLTTAEALEVIREEMQL